ncbi:MAG: hypothetical protein QME51_10150 [Planctomycetota bacterium]|nr:hypothetical protein [Planctomycetota bacterium]
MLCLIWNSSLNNQLTFEIQQIKNKGEPLSYDTFIPPLSDNENAYLVYKKALQGPDFSTLSNYPYNKRFNLLRDVISGQKAETPENIQEIRGLIHDNSILLDAFYQAGLMEKCRVDIDYSKINTNIRLPTIPSFPLYRGKVIESLFLLDGAIRVKLVNNQPAEALKDIDTAIKMLRLFEEPPSLVSMMVTVRGQSIVLKSIQRAIQIRDVKEEFLKNLLQRLQYFKADDKFCKDLLAERIIDMESFTPQYFKNIMKEMWVFSSWFDKLNYRLDYYFYLSPIGKLFLKANKLYYLKIMNQIIEIFSNPPYQTRASQEKIYEEVKSIPCYLPLAHLFLTGKDSFCLKGFYAYKRMVALTEATVFLNIYKARKGEYPETLKDLPEDLLKRIPKNPFSGEDFIYRQKENGFILYSIGPNYQDDGGIYNESKGKDDITYEFGGPSNSVDR